MLKTISEAARNIWTKITDAIKGYFQRWHERLKYFEEHEKYINEILQFDAQYHPSPSDIELLENIKSYIDSNFPNGIEEKFTGISDEELIETFKEIIKDASDLMGVPISEIHFFTPESKREMFVFGFYRREDNSININLTMLLSGDMSLVKEQFYTVFHEMKHALQWAVVLNPESYNIPIDIVEEWAYNFLHYIPCFENDEAYLKQPLEIDTFGLEEVLKGNISIDSLKEHIQNENY